MSVHLYHVIINVKKVSKDKFESVWNLQAVKELQYSAHI